MRGLQVFVRSYRSWEWEVKPVQGEILVSTGTSAPVGETESLMSKSIRMRQEATALVVCADAPVPQAEICHTTQTTSSRNSNPRKNCADGEVVEITTPKKHPKTRSSQGTKGKKTDKEIRTDAEALTQIGTEENRSPPKKRKKSVSGSPSTSLSKLESGNQLELDLWGTAPEISF